jgi:hypothetical protein
MLPVPTCSMLDDQSHSYCCLREITAFVLLLPKMKGAPQVPLRLQQLCKSKMMKDFLSKAPPIRLTECLILINMLFFGWMVGIPALLQNTTVHPFTLRLSPYCALTTGRECLLMLGRFRLPAVLAKQIMIPFFRHFELLLGRSWLEMTLSGLPITVVGLRFEQRLLLF